MPPERDAAALPPKRSRQWLWVILLLLFAFGFFLVWRHGGMQRGGQVAGGGQGFSGPVTLTAATAKAGEIGVYLDAIGTVTPVYTATLYSQVTGVITQVHYREGQMVRKGEPLIDIDPRPYQAQVTTAEGNLERDDNVLAAARMDMARYQAAWARNAISRQQLEDQEKTVLQDEGLVKADQGTLAYDKVQLEYCHITSPINGRVGLRLVDPGNLVTAGTSSSLVVVTQIDPITVIFTLAQNHLEAVLAQMHKGARLTVDAYDRDNQNKLATGKLEALDNQIDTTTGTVKLRANFDNRQGLLFPNQFVNTRLLVTTEHGVTLVPNVAVQHDGQVSFVYVIADGKAAVRNVTTGTSSDGVTVVQGINPGDVVATSSFQKLQNGSKTIILKTAAPVGTSESNTP